jgi:SET domain-containing protein
MTSNETKISFISLNKIQINQSTIEDRGVFATTDIQEGELVERCPMVRLSYRSNYHHDPSIWKYCYTQPKCDCNDCKNHGKYIWMVLGYGMIYNHQDIPNTKWIFDYNKEYADVVASRDIKVGQEIFVTYGTEYFKNRLKVTANESVESVSATPEPPEEDDETFMAKIATLMNLPINT